MAVVYKHIRLDTNEVFYIGIGRNIDRAYSKYNRTKYWHNIVDKVGYVVDIIYDALDWETACNTEIKLIKEYGRRDLNTGTLINLTNGGEGLNGLVRTKEHNAKISKSLKSKGVLPPSQKGTIRSNENKKKISDTLKGRVLSKEHCERIALASANRSDEAKKNKSEGLKRWWAERKNSKL